jgi:hypothetical protein
MIPYANVALIGIPLTATQPGHRRDLLVIGHELGHYAYWHGQLGGQSIRETLKHIVRGEMPYIKNWIEEIFADVFGLVVSQQLAILPWAIDMFTDNHPITFINDNHVHPIDALRPYLFFRTLKILKNKSWLDQEQAQWSANFMINRFNVYQGVHTEMTVRDKGGHVYFLSEDRLGREVIVEFTVAVTNLEEIIKELCRSVFLETNGLSKTNALSNWEDIFNNLPLIPALEDLPHEDLSPLDVLLKETTNLISQIKEQEKSWFKDLEDTLNLINGRTVRAELVSQPDITKSKFDRSFVIIREEGFERPVEPEVWKIVFAADGWTVKGPETQPVGGWEGEPSGGHNPFHL